VGYASDSSGRVRRPQATVRLLRSARACTVTHALKRVIPSGASAKSRDLSSRRSGDGAEAGSAGQAPSNTLGEIPRHRSAQPNGLGMTALCPSASCQGSLLKSGAYPTKCIRTNHLRLGHEKAPGWPVQRSGGPVRPGGHRGLRRRVPDSLSVGNQYTCGNDLFALYSTRQRVLGPPSKTAATSRALAPRGEGTGCCDATCR
jgi:hypothetical protein